jgi:hypothetical protein
VLARLLTPRRFVFLVGRGGLVGCGMPGHEVSIIANAKRRVRADVSGMEGTVVCMSVGMWRRKSSVRERSGL